MPLHLVDTGVYFWKQDRGHTRESSLDHNATIQTCWASTVASFVTAAVHSRVEPLILSFVPHTPTCSSMLGPGYPIAESLYKALTPAPSRCGCVCQGY